MFVMAIGLFVTALIFIGDLLSRPGRRGPRRVDRGKRRK